MQNYKVLCALLSTCMIFSYSFNMETASHQREDIAKQLIVTHNIQEEEKKLLEEIIQAYPEWVKIKPAYAKIMQDSDFSIYTPTYFKDLIPVLEQLKKTSKNLEYVETLKNQIILYITYVAINKQWLRIEDKLNHLNKCFQQYTLSYLLETWERYKPTMIISTIATEIEEFPYEKGTVEEIPSEEEEAEEKIIKEQPLRTTKQEIKTTSRQYDKKANIKPSFPREPKKQPGMISRTINFVWNGISSLFKWIASWFR